MKTIVFDKSGNVIGKINVRVFNSGIRLGHKIRIDGLTYRVIGKVIDLDNKSLASINVVRTESII